jgi:LysR family transcriptional regulator, cys regulon transcriptional activator
MFLRGYVYDFLQLVAPHLTRDAVDRARAAGSQADVDALFEKISLPLK